MNATALRRAAIRLLYCLPLILAFALTVYAALPHLWFVYKGEAQQTLSLFELLSNAQDACDAAFANAEVTAGERSFATLMQASIVVYWVLFAFYWLFGVMSAACSLFAFACEPTHRYANRSKRVMYLLFPNRILYLLACAAPLPGAFLPQLLLFAYKTYLGLEMYTGADPFHDWVAALIAVLLPIILFLLSLPWQKEERLDLYRIYRSPDRAKKKGEERA